MATTRVGTVMASAVALVISALALVVGAKAQEWGAPVWSDEFNSSVKGAPPDASKWTFDVGGSGWGNHELEVYCAAGAAMPAPCDATNPNAFQDGEGHLIIRAVRVSDEPAPAGTWTSARMKTLGLKDFQYGRMESCMKLPVGAGLWPAFWMLGTVGKWPDGGEIDIMENIPQLQGGDGGLGPTKVESTIHGPSSSAKGLFSLTQIHSLTEGQRVDATKPACHAYGAIWSPFMIEVYVDDWRKPFYIRTAADVPPEGRWVFNAAFYFLMNLAVGGDWPGPPDKSTPSPADVVVDYVRVYQAAAVAGPKLSATPVKINAGGVGETVLQVSAAMGSGLMYLSCTTESADYVCSVDSGNALNHSVVDFRTQATQTAKITLKRAPGHESKDVAYPGIRVTAYTVSGGESSIAIPIEGRLYSAAGRGERVQEVGDDFVEMVGIVHEESVGGVFEHFHAGGGDSGLE